MSLPEDVRTVLEARLAVARVTGGKAAALQRRVCADGRLRGSLVYWGAHTGRWTGRGFQPQNLPRPVKGLPVDAWAPDAPALAEELDVPLADVLGSMLRGVLVAPDGWQLAIVDYASVEARGLLWLAGDEDGLEVYRRGEDPYIRAAAGIFEIPEAEVTSTQRQAGKVAVLACGYQGGVGAFARMAGAYGLDTSGLDVQGIVDAWRDQYPLVAGRRKGRWETPDGRWVTTRKGGLWQDVRGAAWAVTRGAPPMVVGRCEWSLVDGHLVCTLPSGRPLVYRDARVEEVDSAWGGRVQGLTYAGPRGRTSTYGGKLVENLTQAVCRDLLADALVRLEAQGVRVVMHVHDEIIAEVQGPEGLRAVEAAMLAAPAWAAGFPIGVEGHLAARYGK